MSHVVVSDIILFVKVLDVTEFVDVTVFETFNVEQGL